MPYTVLHEFGTHFTLSTPVAGYILFDKALCKGKLEKAWIVYQKNRLPVCIFGNEVEPKIFDDFGDTPLRGTT